MDNVISNSKRHLLSKSFHFPEGWVEACIEFLFQEHSDHINEMKNDKWCSLIEQQWLFTDLKDLETPSSLNNIPDKLMKFCGIACFQIMSYKNVSKSFYSQIREIKGTVNENTSVSFEATDNFTNLNTTSSTKTIVLSLTDGVNEISAFEYEPWPNIEMNNIILGSKCRLKGAFIIRNKVAFLKQENIEILGGEVEDPSRISQLSVIEEQLNLNNKKRKMGTKTIKQETNAPKTQPNPRVKSKPKSPITEISRVLKSEIKTVKTNHRETPENFVIVNPNLQSCINSERLPRRDNLQDIEREMEVADEELPLFDDIEFSQFSNDDDDDIFLNIPIDNLDVKETKKDLNVKMGINITTVVDNHIEGHLGPKSVKEERSNAKENTEILVQTGERSNWREHIEMEARTEERGSERSYSEIKSIKVESNSFMEETEERNVGREQRVHVEIKGRTEEIRSGREHSDMKSIKVENNSFIENIEIEPAKEDNLSHDPVDRSEPFIYLIDVFNELSQPDANNIFIKQYKIKGLILSFSTKLTIVNDEESKLDRWDLQVVLGDGTASVDCLMDDRFIAEKIGFSAQHFQEKKKTKLTDDYKKAFKDFQSYIVKCNCGIFVLQVSESCDKLTIVDYRPVDVDTVTALKKRVSQMV